MKNLLLTAGMIILIIFGFYLGKYLYLKPKNITGDKASEIRGELPDGSLFSLHDLRGKYVLIDFWGSWCMPCRETHPQMISLYNLFKDQQFKDAQGFEIVSVGIEKTRENWLNAIRDDQLPWPNHLLTLGDFDSPIVKSYNVRQVPTKFLINPKGVIIAVDPNLEEVAKILDSKRISSSHSG
jgi:thiol-disulfide isomerase/thioredoxin